MRNKKQNGRILTDRGEIDLLAMARVIWSRIRLVLLATFFLATMAGVITNAFIAPTFESSFTAFVNNKAEEGTQTAVTNADTSAAESLANTYAEILRSRPVLEAAAKRGKIDRNYKELSKMVATKIQENTQLVNVTVTAGSSKEAYQLAKTLSEIAPDYLSDIVEGTSMKIVAKPVENEQKVGPSTMKNSVMGALIGFILASAIIVIIDITDTRVKSSEELEESFGYSVVGIIPAFDSFAKEKE